MYGSPDGVRYCQQCDRTTSMVLDHGTGDAICTECAIVLGNGNDPRHPAVASAATKHGVGDSGGADSEVAAPAAAAEVACSVASTKLQAEGGAPAAPPRMRGAVVAPKVRGGGGGGVVTKARGAVPDTNKSLAQGFDAIDNMASRLGLAGNVRDRGKEVLRKVEAAKVCARGRSRDALYAACLHTACRMEGAPRTLKELIAATPDAAATKRDLGKFIHAIKRLLGSNDEEEAGAGQDQAGSKGTNGCGGAGAVVRAGDYLVRYGSAVGMSGQEVSAAQRAASRLDESLDVRRNPQSIAAAIIYMAVQRGCGGGGRSKSVREVSAATGVSESTIKDAYKDLCQHAEVLFG